MAPSNNNSNQNNQNNQHYRNEVKYESSYDRAPKTSAQETIANQTDEIFELRDSAERLYLEIVALKENKESLNAQIASLNTKLAEHKKTAKASLKTTTTLNEQIEVLNYAASDQKQNAKKATAVVQKSLDEATAEIIQLKNDLAKKELHVPAAKPEKTSNEDSQIIAGLRIELKEMEADCKLWSDLYEKQLESSKNIMRLSKRARE